LKQGVFILGDRQKNQSALFVGKMKKRVLNFDFKDMMINSIIHKLKKVKDFRKN
jgi:hypothetical protein